MNFCGFFFVDSQYGLIKVGCLAALTQWGGKSRLRVIENLRQSGVHQRSLGISAKAFGGSSSPLV